MAAVFLGNTNGGAALAAMVAGGGSTVLLSNLGLQLPLGLDPIVFGIALSAAAFIIIDLSGTRKRSPAKDQTQQP